MRWLKMLLLLATFLALVPETLGAEPRPRVFEVRLDNEAITPGIARFLERAIEQAEQEGAQCLVVMLDTPGGLLTSTRRIVKMMLRSRTCVVVYVAPSGAEAASAGTFITLASHVAAMAPGTEIGAAHPVQFGGLPGAPPSEPAAPPNGSEKKAGDTEQQKEKNDAQKQEERPAASSTPMEEKIVNNTVAWARSLAELRGRNAEWAALAVSESKVATATEALEKGIVDLLADDLNDLLAKLDGREVTLPQGSLRLNTAEAEVRTLEMWWGEKVLTAISNPNVAFLLLMFGFYGILFELYSPGWGVAGTLGIVCLVLAFFGLAVLPVDYVGLALLLVALGLFAAEVFVTSYGALTVAGIVCMVLGGLMLVESPTGFLRVSLEVIIPVAAATALIAFFLIGGAVRAHRGRVHTGSEGLIGSEAVAQEEFTPSEDRYAGSVQVHGELWKAVSPTAVAAGQRLHIEDRRGLTLFVRVPEKAGGPSTPT